MTEKDTEVQPTKSRHVAAEPIDGIAITIVTNARPIVSTVNAARARTQAPSIAATSRNTLPTDRARRTRTTRKSRMIARKKRK